MAARKQGTGREHQFPLSPFTPSMWVPILWVAPPIPVNLQGNLEACFSVSCVVVHQLSVETDNHREEGERSRRGWIRAQYVWGHLYTVGVEVGRTLQVGEEH